MKPMFFGFILSISLAVGAFADPAVLERLVQEAAENGGDLTGFSFHVIEGDEPYSATIGDAAPAGIKLAPQHMFRIASVTKTYTAAAVLRLVEEGAVGVAAPLDTLIDEDINGILLSDGYQTNQITLKQVLSHTAGLYDHAQSAKYIQRIMDNPQHVWTRKEQIAAGAEWGEPVGTPGDKFFYSDTGYLLLGHILERMTGKPLPVAVRNLLAFDKHGLQETVWERGDSKPVLEAQRVHQYLSGADTFDWDPSVDLFGGGGLLASPRDMARFYGLLMAGKIFEKPETLSLMLSPAGLPQGSPYRLGLFEKHYDGLRVYEHGGFWGTLVMHDPATGITVAGAAIKQVDYPKLVNTMVAFLKGKRP